jgi:predicted nucleotide-binding protein
MQYHRLHRIGEDLVEEQRVTIPDYSGYWTGTIQGTNTGGFVFDIRQSGDNIEGEAKLHEAALGQYEYKFTGVASDKLSLRLVPVRHSGGLALDKVQVIATLDADGALVGRWKSDFGTEGVFQATRFDPKLKADLPKSNSVFLVHGHDERAKHSVARFLEQLGITPVILQEQINRGMTVIEKFENLAGRAGFAIVLMTPDDMGYAAGKEQEKCCRPRQNVILELGYFVGRIGRSKTLVLTKGEVEMPSDVLGLVYESMDRNEGWKMRLARELKASGFEIDLNRAIA